MEARTLEKSSAGILLVGNFLSGSIGTRGVCEDLGERLRSTAGLEIHTTSDKPGRLARLFDMVSTAWKRRSEYSVAQVDVYSGGAFFLAESVCRVLRCAGKPYILTLHGGNLPEFGRRWPRRVRRLLQSANVVTTPSHYLQDQMKGYRSDLRLLPNPLNLGAYPYQHRLNPRPTMTWLRAFHSTYNPQLAPRVVAALVQEFPDIQLTMIGPDRGDGALNLVEQAAVSCGVRDRLDLHGAISKSEVPHWLNRADIFLNTTNVDNAPVSVLEAMACGLCVVSTNVGGIPYLLKHDENALLVPPDDIGAMAAGVRRILSEPGLAARLSEQGRRKTEALDWSMILPQWCEIFSSLAPKQRNMTQPSVA